MTCYMIKLRYDGTNYAGYQKQANANTVGGEVLNALTTLFGSVEKLSGCSRTDSGVHANCYCASFHSEKNIEPQKVIRGLNGILPRDIAVFDCAEVSPDFHARYSVKAKEYIYLILNSSVRDPFYEKYSLLFSPKIDVDELNAECTAFVGTHDFAAFAASGSVVKDTVRTIHSIEIARQGKCVSMQVRGNGFLYNMVRILAGTLEGGAVRRALASGSRLDLGVTAPACGLTLMEVFYDA